MPSSLFHPDIMDTETGVGSPHAGILLGADPEPGSQDGEPQESLRFALGQLSLLAGERLDCGGAGRADALDPAPAVEPVPGGVGFAGLQILEPPGSPPSCSPPTEIYCPAGFHLDGGSMLGDPGAAVIGSRKRSVNMTECVPVPSSEHVAEIVGRQGRLSFPAASAATGGRCVGGEPKEARAVMERPGVPQSVPTLSRALERAFLRAARTGGSHRPCHLFFRPRAVTRSLLSAHLKSIAGAARDCCLCFESQVTAALVPCGHNLFCMDCAGQICESPEPECPVCHTPATQCIRIFS
nr:PREDICTED: RNA-binding protein MEX3D-like [Lepisosteus oculatus]